MWDSARFENPGVGLPQLSYCSPTRALATKNASLKCKWSVDLRLVLSSYFYSSLVVSITAPEWSVVFMEVLGQPGTIKYCLSSFNTPRWLSKGHICRKDFESCIMFVWISFIMCSCTLTLIFYRSIYYICAILGSSDRKFFFLALGICLLILPGAWSASCASVGGICS